MARDAARKRPAAHARPDREPREVGPRDQAQELLSQLEEMMNNLQAGRPQQGQSQDGQQLRDAPADGQARRDHAPPAGDDERDLPHGSDAARPAPAGGDQQQGQDGRPRRANRASSRAGQGQGKPMTPEEFAEAMSSSNRPGQAQGRPRGSDEGPGRARASSRERLRRGGRGDGRGRQGSLGELQGERAVGEQGRALEALRRGAQGHDAADAAGHAGRSTAAASKAAASPMPTATRSADRAPLAAPISAKRSRCPTRSTCSALPDPRCHSQAPRKRAEPGPRKKTTWSGCWR